MAGQIAPGFFRTEIIGLSAAIFFFAFRILEWNDVRKISWEIFLIVGGGLTLGQILIDTGSADILAGKLIVLISFMPKIAIILAVISITMVLTNFVNNSSATIILVPVVMKLSEPLGINERLLAMAVAMSTTIASLTPVAMPSFSMIYGTGKVKKEEMVRTGLSIAVVCAPVLAVIIYLFNFLLF